MTSPTPPPSSPERDGPGSRLRLDALSVFLGASMLTLLAMYALDARHSDALEAHAQLAAKLPLGPLKTTCTALPTGADGSQVLIVCKDLDRYTSHERLQLLWAEQPPPEWLETVALRDAQGTLVCPRDLSSCSEHTPPGREAMKASRRRPTRQ